MEGKVSFKQFVSLYILYAKMDLAWLLRDKMFAIIAIISDTIANLSAVTGIFLLAWRFNGLGGMNKYEVLLMMAYTTIISGLYQMFFSNNNTGHISRRIGRGQLEHMYIQPLPFTTQLMTEGFIPFTGSSNIISGTVILFISITNLNINLTWWWWLSLIGNFIITVALIVSLSYLASVLTFYMPIQAEEISSYVVDTYGYISTFPLSGMPKYLQIPLISILPTGLMAWFPTMALLGKPPLGLPSSFPLLFTIFLLLITMYLFKKGLRYYVKKGINRYHPMGHRR